MELLQKHGGRAPWPAAASALEDDTLPDHGLYLPPLHSPHSAWEIQLEFLLPTLGAKATIPALCLLSMSVLSKFEAGVAVLQPHREGETQRGPPLSFPDECLPSGLPYKWQ